MPTILGLSGFYHDSAAAIVVGGRVVAAVQEERCTRIKADAAFPENAIRSCLEIAGLAAGDLSIGFFEVPSLKFDRLIETHFAGAPKGFSAFRAAMPSWLSTKLRLRDQVTRFFGSNDAPELYFGLHHQSHAASAFYPSPFESAAILTIDGVGEWATASIFHGQGNRLKPLVEQRFPHSLGLLYSAVTSYCGFEMNTGEYKLMGLAAEGKPRYFDRLTSDIVHVVDDGSVQLDQRFFDYCHGLRMTSPRFHRYFGREPRKRDESISNLDRDLAASVQAITELSMSRMAKHARGLTGEAKLCLAGGVALNCVAVGKLVADDVVDDVWVQPAAGDAGGAVGVALWLAHERFNVERKCVPSDSFSGAFLGPRFNELQVQQAIEAIGVVARHFDDDASLCQEVANLISNGGTVGWFQGAMEFGPRALGHRSILADPRDSAMKDRLNNLVKHRESFRPFAPAVLREFAASYFATGDRVDHAYMTRTFRVLQPDLIPAVTHLDGTARIQTVDRERNPKFTTLLNSFHALTGIPVLLNTICNDCDEPIVCSPEDAIRCFFSTNLDAVVIENFLIHKQSSQGLRLSGPKPSVLATPRWFTLSLACQALVAGFIIDWRFGRGTAIATAGSLLAVASTCAISPSVKNLVWTRSTRFTHAIGCIASGIVLAAVFYLAVTPIGLWRRLCGHRPLDQSGNQTGWLPFTMPSAASLAAGDVRQLPWWLELVEFLRHEKKWWMIPIVLSLALIAVAASVGGSVAPWIYAIW